MADVLADAVASALSAVAAALPSLSKTMEADGATGSVVIASSMDKGVDAISGDTASEELRVVAQASDFPELSRMSLVTFDDSPRLVTSLRNTGNAALFIGLSAEMQSSECAVTGSRRARGIALTAPALVLRDSAAPESMADAYAVNDTPHYWILIRCDDWTENGEPMIGDSFRFVEKMTEVTAVAASVQTHPGYWLISARGR